MNSGHQALSVAYQFGASRVVLLGYDYQRTGGLSHWHGDHPKGLGNLGNLEGWCRNMGRLAVDLASAGVDVINASRETALSCFPRQPLEQALQ